MSKSLNPNIPNLIMMIRPKHFGFNAQTATSNSFQNESRVENVSDKAIKEFDQAVSQLQSKKIRVKVIEDGLESLPDAVFSNNWISHIPFGPIIIYPMFTANRRAEVREDVVQYFQSELQVKELIDLREESAEDEYLEGTGSIVFDHENKIAYACISPRTDVSLLTKLAKRLNYEVISFESVDLKGKQIYHTNVMMSIGQEIVLVCLESIPDLIERSMLLASLKKSGKEVIELSYTQMNQFAGNAFEVAATDGKNYYIMSTTAHGALNRDQIDRISEYSEIIDVDIPIIEKIGGGSIRCMLTGFYAYSK